MQKNPLYRALNSKAHAKTSRRRRKTVSTRNPLAVALKKAQEGSKVGKQKRTKPQSNNPLAAALKRGSSPQRRAIPAGPKVQGRRHRQARAGGRSSRQNGVKRRTDTQRHARKIRGSSDSNSGGSSSTTESPTDTYHPVGRARAGIFGLGLPDLSIKGSSKPRLLRITNLSPGVTKTDVLETMWKFGSVLKVLVKETNSRRYGRSVTAELFYLTDESLVRARETMDGRKADDRRLKVDIVNESEIIRDPQQWRSIIDEIKMTRKERLMQTVITTQF